MSVMALFKLDGKTAIVTGGGRGLGAMMAEAFAEAGANVVLCSRKVEACQEIADKLAKMGVATLALACDVTNESDVENLVQQTLETFGSIDILVNNSGATWGAPVVDMPIDAWKKVIDVNVTGTFLMSREVGKAMIQQKSGKIINISSVAGLGGIDPTLMDTIGYNTSKGAVITFTKDLAAKWGQHNINVNAIAPGFFPTKMSKAVMDKGREGLLSRTPLNRFGTEQDLKGTAVFLASKASDYITGDVVIVDGGMHVL
ncbi:MULTISPECIES: SDR family oxidoreductase [Planococcus]|uniref:Gluconate 5-dehydrogenase n=1 Tax=Planococcus faecalis TaxID=1598147 RepID=A0ABM6IQN9_9BACL|nr:MULTISPECIES: SDR family oxidoreductase [Planococcus]AQU78122.1 gluconate 5-dehydrogenase [Planococcus faecalis]MDJ0331246.1 SDR family oxidoreductase [Planococcus sp. S3-L1]